MTTPSTKNPVTFKYNATMLPYFKEGFDTFQKKSGIALTGIDYKVEGEWLFITITEEQQEKWLFHLGLTIGIITEMDGDARVLREENERLKARIRDLGEDVRLEGIYNLENQIRIRREREAILMERSALLDAMAVTIDAWVIGSEPAKLLARYKELSEKQLPQIP